MAHRKSVVAPEGFPYIITGAALAWFAALVDWTGVSVILGLLTIAVACFFRDPERVVPTAPGSIVSAADGTVMEVASIAEPHFLDREMKRVTVFLSLLDCHINRFPLPGQVVGTRYVEGKFHPANLRRASRENERHAVHIRTQQGDDVVVVQIAGLLARRIVFYPETGDVVEKGERMGMIKFGSRVDVYLPLEAEIDVKPGDKVRGGETVLGWLRDEEKGS